VTPRETGVVRQKCHFVTFQDGQKKGFLVCCFSVKITQKRAYCKGATVKWRLVWAAADPAELARLKSRTILTVNQY
jgi:hypothetical protein